LLKFLSTWLQKQSRATQAIVGWYHGLNQPVWTPADYANLAREGYQQNTHVYACVNVLARSCKGIPLNVYRKRRNLGRLDEVETGPLVNLLRKPSPRQNGASFVESCVSYYLLAGNCYVERVGPGKNGAGEPRELYALRPDRMTVLRGDAVNPISGYAYMSGTPNEVKYDPELIWHWKTFHPLNDWYGMSPIEAAARSVDQNNEATKWNVALLQNSARPPGGLFSKEPLTQDQFARLDEFVRENWQGPLNAGKPMLGEGGMEWQSFGLAPGEMDWADGLTLSAEQICECFSVPPEIVGVNRSKKFNSYPEARKALYEEGVLPILDDFCAGLTEFLRPHFGGDVSIGYNKDEIEAIREDQDKVHVRVGTDVANGLLTINEAREAIGYDASDEEGADALHVPANRIPLETVSTWEQSETQEPTATGGGNKALNVDTAERKDAYWRGFEADREGWYRAAETKVKRLFRAELKAIEKATHYAQIEAIPDEMRPDWMRTLGALAENVADEFAKRTYAALSGKSMKDADDPWWLAIRDYVGTQVAERVTQVAQTTRELIRSAIQQSIDSGEGVYQAQGRIRKLYLEQIIPHRSEVIARTEIIAASNHGSYIAAQSTGLKLRKSWLSSRDSRVREWHASADGQKVAMDEPFRVNGERLMYPGDTSLGASGDNVIQCRCTQTYEVAR
jgi:HK97 family phage portal protein